MVEHDAADEKSNLPAQRAVLALRAEYLLAMLRVEGEWWCAAPLGGNREGNGGVGQLGTSSAVGPPERSGQRGEGGGNVRRVKGEGAAAKHVEMAHQSRADSGKVRIWSTF